MRQLVHRVCTQMNACVSSFSFSLGLQPTGDVHIQNEESSLLSYISQEICFLGDPKPKLSRLDITVLYLTKV